MYNTIPFSGAPTADAITEEQDRSGDCVRYSARFDAYFSVSSDRWLEPVCTCGDPYCPSTGRPDRPSECCPADLDDFE